MRACGGRSSQYRPAHTETEPLSPGCRLSRAFDAVAGPGSPSPQSMPTHRCNTGESMPRPDTGAGCLAREGVSVATRRAAVCGEPSARGCDTLLAPGPGRKSRNPAQAAGHSRQSDRRADRSSLHFQMLVAKMGRCLEQIRRWPGRRRGGARTTLLARGSGRPLDCGRMF